MTVRKIGANSIGVERVFPVYSDSVDVLLLLEEVELEELNYFILEGLKVKRQESKRLRKDNLYSLTSYGGVSFQFFPLTIPFWFIILSLAKPKGISRASFSHGIFPGVIVPAPLPRGRAIPCRAFGHKVPALFCIPLFPG